ncbi:MAG: S-methyl-5'-thioadenosine phosphorylase [Turneriella sp.]|nr:S-methyl-5'-thioadenosine phosphorylase [Turneriella sp.]
MKQKADIGIIGGTGVYGVEGMKILEKIRVKTAWGNPSDEITLAEYEEGGKTIKLAFLPRHGKGHFIPPTKIPAHANLAALKMLGCEAVLAFSAVGSLKEEIPPGDFVLPSQIIDRTRHRRDTYFDEGIVVHVSFGDPMDAGLAAILKSAITGLKLPLHENETLICMEGPQFSTRAESKLYKSWGAGIINMSVLPEAKLARELELPYQMICMATDYDAWRDHDHTVTVEDVMAVVKKNSENAQRVLKAAMAGLIAKKGSLNTLTGSVKFGIMTAPAKRPAALRKKYNSVLPGYF